MTAATYQDILDLPDNLIGEILNNQLVVQNFPPPKEALAGSHLTGILCTSCYDQEYWILNKPEIHLGNHVIVPNLMSLKRKKSPNLLEQEFVDVAPDWICEILSPSTARTDRIVKMPVYAEFEINHLWIVDPNLQTLEVFERQNKHWLLLKTYQQDDLVCTPPFVELEFSLNALWS